MSDELTEVERHTLDAWAPMVPPPGFADRVLAGAPVPLPRPRRTARNVMVIGIALTVAAGIALVVLGSRAENGPPPVAELTRAAGPVERAEGVEPWRTVEVGTKLYLGDAVRTADGGADLVIAGQARLAMQPYTVLRFGGDRRTSQISVELGNVELTGNGRYGFDIGEISLANNAGVRISSRGAGQASIQLTIGDAQITTHGETIALAAGHTFDVGIAVSVVTMIDAELAPVPPDDMGEGPGFDVPSTTVTVTGKRVEIQHPGATTWELLPPGAGGLMPGDRVRVGAGSTAQLSNGTTMFDLGAGGRAVMREDGSLSLEAGRARVTSMGNATIALAGGELALPGASNEPAEARLDATARDTKVTVTRGDGKLTGSGGGELAMARGETATLAANGTIRVVEAIPTYFDLRAVAGETFTVHDPGGATAVQLAFAGKCPGPGFIELDRDSRFRTARISAGRDAANVAIPAGSWAYRLRCSSNGIDSAPVAAGRIAVVRDSGNRALPRQAARNSIDADGRNYRISYQSVIPTLEVRARGTAGTYTLHLATGGKDETFTAKTPKIVVPGSRLKEASYTFWIDRDGVKDSSVSTLVIEFDNTAPQVYIEAPSTAAVWSGELEVRGAMLPGWTATIDGVELPSDAQRRFRAKVAPPSQAKALAIKLAHPQRGVHYYLRRSGK